VSPSLLEGFRGEVRIARQIMAIALWCFYHALGGRKLLKTQLLDV
jgi:hypothetical protein